jgi:hypothetical protein
MKPQAIVIHHSLTLDNKLVSWDNIRRYHTEKLGWRDIGYHYGIEKVDEGYEILVGRMMNESGAHTRQDGMNQRSLGICFIGNFDDNAVPDEQWYLGLKLVLSLCETLLIPRSQVFGHNQFASYKSCPGRKFDMDNFRLNLLSVA